MDRADASADVEERRPGGDGPAERIDQQACGSPQAAPAKMPQLTLGEPRIELAFDPVALTAGYHRVITGLRFPTAGYVAAESCRSRSIDGRLFFPLPRAIDADAGAWLATDSRPP